MNEFGRFYLDKEKDISVDLQKDGSALHYVLRTPNHGTGRLIRNLAAVCRLPLSQEESGLLVIRGTVPCYIDGEGRRGYVLRLGDTKVANIYPDGTVEVKATIPAIAKTLMSQTKDYTLGQWHTIVKSYILEDVKFRTDLHTHMNANLPADVLIALGIYHQLEYPLYYIKKLELRLTKRQEEILAHRRARSEKRFADTPLVGKYRDRQIDDATSLNFADLILKNRHNAAYNLARIRNSLAVMKDGQAVFTNLEKVYLYRYVFTKGTPDAHPFRLEGVDHLPDPDIARFVRQMEADHEGDYAGNSLFQDKLLWIARHYRDCGITYAEISDTTLVKAAGAPQMLAEVHEVMPRITAETGVTLRFLAAMRRIPLMIVQNKITPEDYLRDNLRVVRAVAGDPYVAGSDIVGEEINDIRELAPAIRCLVTIAGENPGYVLRIHAGENDSLTDNVANSLKLVEGALAPGQPMPHVRIGHGLYTANLKSRKGKMLVEHIVKDHVVLEFQLSSNVRLNNLSDLSKHPLKSYLQAGVFCVQGTDGGALYGTDSMDEQIALERLLNLSHEELSRMCYAERRIIRESVRVFRQRDDQFEEAMQAWMEEKAAAEGRPAPVMGSYTGEDVRAFYEEKIASTPVFETPVMVPDKKKYVAERELRAQTKPLPDEGLPVIIAGGSFHADRHQTVVTDDDRRLIDALLAGLDPKKAFFVIGHRLTGQERYLVEANAGRFRIFAFVPTKITLAERNHLIGSGVSVRISIEETNMSLYKSIAYEVFKRRPSVLIAFDGNSAGANLIQEAKNARYRAAIYVSRRSRTLSAKAGSLAGYATVFGPGEYTKWDVASW